MSEIWNLSTLCRCCHSDGCFKKLNLPYQSENSVEVYETLLKDILGITINQPLMEHASYTICDNCIKKLRDASLFKNQVLACEQKFKVYCSNEQFLNSETVKPEIRTNSPENYDVNLEDDVHRDDDLQQDDYDQNYLQVKEETTIEVDMRHPIKETDEKIKDNVKDVKSNDQKTILNSKTTRKKVKSDFSKTRRKLFETYIIREKNENSVTYSCKTCENIYKTKQDILKHIRSQHYSRCKCEQCGKAFQYESHLETHVKTYHGKSYTCRHCEKKYDNKYRLTAHEKTHTNQQVYQCDICQKVLRYRNTLRKHILLLHNGDNKAMLCDFCGWSFTQKCNLEAHIKTVHLKMRPFSCSICGKTYTAKKHVKSHMKTAHSGNSKPYQCDYCSKCFACPKSFKIHRLTHENHFSCRYCPTVFHSKIDVEIHTKSHTKHHLFSSPYSCHFCGKVLLSKYTLNRHLEIHSGIRRFSCDICGMKFTQKALLKRHQLRKHDPSVKIEKVKCDLCKKIVRDIGKHMEIHDADKRKFFCDMCGKNYPTNNALTRHKQQKHYGVSYDCEICGKKYIKKGSLKTHKLKVHKVKKEFEIVASGQNIVGDVVTVFGMRG